MEGHVFSNDWLPKSSDELILEELRDHLLVIIVKDALVSLDTIILKSDEYGRILIHRLVLAGTKGVI